MKMNKKKITIYVTLLIIVVCLAIGYAYLSTTLNINGTSVIGGNTWDVHFANIQVVEGSTTGNTQEATITSPTQVQFSVSLDKPGDYYEFTVDVVNGGTIDAMVGTITQGVYASNGTTPKTLPDCLEYTVTYSDGISIEQNHLLEHNSTETYRVRVYYKEDITASQLLSTDDNFVFKFGVNYTQKNSNAVARSKYLYYFGYYSMSQSVSEFNPNYLKTDYHDVMTLTGKTYFSRFLVENDSIKEAYLGLEYNNKIYYLRGYVLSQYNANKAILNSMFAAEDCEQGSDYYVCQNDNLRINVSQCGSVHAAFNDQHNSVEMINLQCSEENNIGTGYANRY